MNRRMIFFIIGKILQVNTLLLLLPAAVSLIYREHCVYAFLISAAISACFGFLIAILSRPKNHVIFAKEGFFIVSFSWIAVSLIGSLPFVISREIPSFINAFFETVSGLTTTGASILNNVEGLSQGMLFWRSFTHWIGGMGVLVFIMAFMSNVSDRPIHIMRAEMPGPVIGKIMPRAKDTAKVLYIIYVVITALEIIMLLFGGMSLFESAVLSFGTAGTGGFGIRGDSIGGYSPYVQWVITVFMLIFGVNFNLYFLILIKKFSTAIKSTEFWTYITMVLVSTGIISVSIYPMYKNVGEVIRLSVFQSASIITTTGYSTADFNTWPALVKALLFVLLFSGACAGSTAGGFKISRIIILIKAISKEIRRMLHTHSVQTVKFEGKAVEDTTLYGIMIYLAIYFACIFVVFLLISLEPFGIETNLSAAISCFNNVGPGFGSVGPAYSYAGYSAFSKLVLSAAMLFGRLEIFPVLVLFSPAAWKKN